MRAVFDKSFGLPASLTERTTTVAVASRAIFFRSCKADIDWTTVQFFAIQLVDSFLVVVIVFEFDETKALTTAAFAVCNNAGASNWSDSLKKSFEAVIVSCISKATDK